MAELYIGTPLFASESERDHLSMLMEVLGAPPQQLVEISPKKLTYFDEQGVVKPYTTSKGKVR
jgi:dual specificity tyrosine-phosphorylation-regulated kinase 2/3/4